MRPGLQSQKYGMSTHSSAKLFEVELLSPAISTCMWFDSWLCHNVFIKPGLRTFRLSSHSIVASQSGGNPAFTVHAVCYCWCFQSRDESYSMLLLTTRDLMFRKIFELWCFDKLHVEMDVVLKVVIWFFICGIFKQMLTTFAKFELPLCNSAEY